MQQRICWTLRTTAFDSRLRITSPASAFRLRSPLQFRRGVSLSILDAQGGQAFGWLTGPEHEFGLDGPRHRRAAKLVGLFL